MLCMGNVKLTLYSRKELRYEKGKTFCSNRPYSSTFKSYDCLCSNVEDAKALYEQVTEKQKSVTDMNAYYDYQIHLSGSALEGVEDLSNMRLEMNVRMNHLTDMGNLQYSSYSRATVPGQESMISTMYYKDGTCYMETAGTKIKYPMDLTQMQNRSAVRQ